MTQDMKKEETKLGIRIFKLRGIWISLNYSWFIIFFLIFWSLSAGFLPRNYPGYTIYSYMITGFIATLLFFSSILIHELTHSFMAIHLGIKIPEITFFIFGGISRLSEEPKTPQTELKIAIVGPLSSFFLALFFWAIKVFITGSQYKLMTAMFGYLMWVNAALGIFNLIPGFPLDGGRVLRSLLWLKTGSLIIATKIASDIGKGFALILMILGGIEIFSGALIGGLWLFFIGLFLRGIAGAGYQELIIKQSLESVNVNGLMIRDVICVPQDLSISNLITDYFFHYHYRGFPVVHDSKVLGMISILDIKNIPKEMQQTKTVGEVMEPVSERICISPEASLAEALRKMTREGLGRLLVLKENKMAGIITKAVLLRFLEIKSILNR